MKRRRVIRRGDQVFVNNCFGPCCLAFCNHFKRPVILFYFILSYFFLLPSNGLLNLYLAPAILQWSWLFRMWFSGTPPVICCASVAANYVTSVVICKWANKKGLRWKICPFPLNFRIISLVSPWYASAAYRYCRENIAHMPKNEKYQKLV